MISVKSLARVVVASMLLICAEAREACAQAPPLMDDWRWVHYGLSSGLPWEASIQLIESAETPWAATPRGIAWFDGYRWIEVGAGELDLSLIELAAPDHDGGIYVTLAGTLYHVDRSGYRVMPVNLDGERIAMTQFATTGPDGFYTTRGRDVVRWHAGQTSVLPRLPGSTVGEPQIELAGVAGSLWARTILPSSDQLWELVDSSWVRRRILSAFTPRLVITGSAHTVLVANQSPERSEVWIRSQTGAESGHFGPEGETLTGATVSPEGEVTLTYLSGLVEVRREGRWRIRPRELPGILGIRSASYVSDGGLWLAAEGGLYLRNAEPRWRRDFDLWAGEPTVHSILPASNGEVWVGGAAALVVRRSDGSTERLQSILGTPLGPVTALAEDSEGGIWIGSGSGFDGAFRWFDGQWRYYGAEQGLGAQRVHAIVPDREGRLWFLSLSEQFGAEGPGPYVLDGDTFERWGPADELLSGRIYDFTEASDGSRWFATRDALSRWHDGEWTHWTAEDGLRSDRVFTLGLDADDRLWFGHGDGPRGLGFIDSDDSVVYLPWATYSP